MKQITLVTLLLLGLSANAQWLTLQPLNTLRQEMPSTVLNGKIYTPGGIAADFSTLMSMEVYDPVLNKWDTGVDMLYALNHHAMVTADGKIFVMGGYNSVIFTPTTTFIMYNPDSSKWISLGDLPAAISAADAVTYNNKIYLFGGKGDNGVLNYTLEYDVATNNWTQKANMPTPREHHCAVLCNNLIYVIAGRGTSGADTTVEVYNPATDTWTRAAHLPTGRSGLDAVAVNGKIFVMGGEGGSVHNENEMYDPATNIWTILPVIPHARHGLGVVAMGDTVFVIGGATQQGFGPCDLNEAFIVTSVASGIPVAERENGLSMNCSFNNSTSQLVMNVISDVTLNAEWQLVDMMERIITKGNTVIHAGGNTISVNELHLANGIYVVGVTVEGRMVSRRIVIG